MVIGLLVMLGRAGSQRRELSTHAILELGSVKMKWRGLFLRVSLASGCKSSEVYTLTTANINLEDW